MTDEIDDVLYDWFMWSNAYRPAIGYGRADSTCRDFKISRQWMDFDELSEEVEHSLRESIGKQVEPLVFALETRYRVAINTSMRNMDAGVSVFSNPRNPTDQDRDYQEAKAQLCPKFFARGLIKALVNFGKMVHDSAVVSSHA